jgi:hypothetical protein
VLDPAVSETMFVASNDLLDATGLAWALWYRRGGESSERQWLDTLGVIAVQGKSRIWNTCGGPRTPSGSETCSSAPSRCETGRPHGVPPGGGFSCPNSFSPQQMIRPSLLRPQAL